MALDYLNSLGSLGGLVGGGTIPADATPEAIKRRRAVQAAIAAQKRKFPTTLGEGMTYLGEAVGERMADDRLTEAEKVLAARDRTAPLAPVAAVPIAAPAPAAAVAPAAVAPAPTAAPNTFDGKPITTVPVRKSEADPALLERLTAMLTGGEVPQENPTVGAEAPQVLGGPTQPDVQLAALGGAGGTMTDAPPPGAGFRPPAATVTDDTITPTDIKPMPVRTAQVGAPPSGVLPGSDALMFASPAFRPLAPRAADTSQSITPAPKPYDPGPQPQPTGMTPAMAQNLKIANDPQYGEGVRAEAARRYTEQKKAYDDAFTKSYTLWSEAKKKQLDPATQLGLTQSHLANEKTLRELQGEGWQPASEPKLAELARRGMVPPAGQIVYENRRGELKFGPTPPATTNINLGDKGEESAVKEFHKQVGKNWAETLGEGMTAADDKQNVAELRRLAGDIKFGPEAAIKSFLGKYGVKTEGVGKIEAFEAAINRMVPTQRVPGSGATSDFDAKMMKGGLAQLMNTPEGNALVFDTLDRLADNKMKRAEIVAAWAMDNDPNKKIGTYIKEMMKLQTEARAMSDRVKAHLEASAAPKATTTSSPPEEHDAAVDWATKNPTDPRAIEIKRLRGIP